MLGYKFYWDGAEAKPPGPAREPGGRTMDTGAKADLFATLQGLVDAWCDRRCLKALRAVLRGYPLSSPLTDGWGELLLALQDVRAFARDEITASERAEVNACVRTLEQMMNTGLNPRVSKLKEQTGEVV